MQRPAQALADDSVVHDAREVVRGLLEDGRIVRAPTTDRTTATGRVRFKDFGVHALQLAGTARSSQGVCKLSGSGGRI